MKIEDLILNHLINSEEYTRKSFPFIKSEYFHDPVYSHLFGIIENYMKYMYYYSFYLIRYIYTFKIFIITINITRKPEKMVFKIKPIK